MRYANHQEKTASGSNDYRNAAIKKRVPFMSNAMKKRFNLMLPLVVILAGAAAAFAIDVKPGTWGGRGIVFVVEKNSATIQLDCGSATISSRVRTGKDQKFTATGLYTRRAFGPVLRDALPRPQRARFEGQVTGKKMRLKVTLVDSGDVIGDFTLERGKQGQLTRCY
jgi:hypothetical protein